MKFKVLTKTILYRVYEVEAGSADEAEGKAFFMEEDRTVRTAEEIVMTNPVIDPVLLKDWDMGDGMGRGHAFGEG